jgi:orotate phosphoribosyltransferase-like protein
MQKLVAINDRGHRIGQEHPGAKLTDEEVAVLLDLRDEGYSYAWLAQKFEVSKSCARWICTGRNRNQSAARLVRVSVSG